MNHPAPKVAEDLVPPVRRQEENAGSRRGSQVSPLTSRFAAASNSTNCGVSPMTINSGGSAPGKVTDITRRPWWASRSSAACNSRRSSRCPCPTPNRPASYTSTPRVGSAEHHGARHLGRGIHRMSALEPLHPSTTGALRPIRLHEDGHGCLISPISLCCGPGDDTAHLTRSNASPYGIFPVVHPGRAHRRAPAHQIQAFPRGRRASLPRRRA